MSRDPSTFRVLLGSRILWIGVALFCIGPGSLLVASTIMKWQGDPDAPVGPLICATVTFWPSVIMIMAGLAVGILRLLGRRPPQRPPTR